MYILGISAFYHDSSVCLMKDGKVLFAAQEERFSRIKHDNNFPLKSIEKALASEDININDIEIISYYEKPFLKFERLIDTYKTHAPKGFLSFKKAIKATLGKKIWVEDIIRKQTKFKGEIIFCEHHESHAASAFFPSPFEEATILTIDGVGEKTTASLAIGRNNKIEILEEQFFPHSLGLFYSAMTYYCGFKVNSGEYKLMGLAPYGKPIYTDKLKQAIKINDNGSVELNLTYFNYEVGNRMTSKKFEVLMGNKKRNPESEMTAFYMDVAASTQKITEEAILKMVAYGVHKTGIKNVCLAGGVALNCKANGELLKSNFIDSLWIQPAAGDSGTALGATYIAWYHYLNKQRIIQEDSLANHGYLGTQYTQKEVQVILDQHQLIYHYLEIHESLNILAKELAKGKVVGWFQGKMEFGPRALCHRSILANPLIKDMKKHLNYAIKKREGFRPFAPVVKEDRSHEFFNILKPSKYMLNTYTSDKKKLIPSCIHEDNTARVQTVNEKENPWFYQLLDAFEKQSGYPVLINTSFNVRGEPIVESPNDALSCFFSTDMDILFIEGLLVLKEENKSLQLNQTTYELD